MQQTRHLYILRGILSISDIALLSFSLFISYLLTNDLEFASPDELLYRKHIIINSLTWLLVANITKLYHNHTIGVVKTFYQTTWLSLVLHSFFLGTYFYLTYTTFPVYFFSAFISIILVGFILSRLTTTYIQEVFINKYWIKKSVAILGENQGGLKFATYLKQQKNFSFYGFLDDTDENIFTVAAQNGIKEVYVSLLPAEIKKIDNLLLKAEKQCVRLRLVPDFYSIDSYRINNMENFTVLSLRNEPLEALHNRFKKRLFDIAFSLMVIVFILSWLYPLLAILIKTQSPGPVLFKQIRSGRDNRPFMCFKFRSMKMNPDSDKKQATQNDDRVTPIGKFMRQTSLDEFPQFFNVLFGDMSIVGPRPHMVQHTEQYRTLIEQYMVRQFLKPGITGWAQVNGFRGETNQEYLMKKRIEHDIWYMERWSEMLDVKIILMTIINMIKGEENAY